MELPTLETILVTAALVLPGFVTVTSFRMLVPKKELIDQRGILAYLTFSALNYAVFGWIVWLIFISGIANVRPLIAIIMAASILLIGPALVGILFGILWQKNIPKNIASWFNIRILHHIPNSWDYLFDSINAPCWMLVTLNDDRQVAGYFSTLSFASSDIDERDLFLEQVYKIVDDGTWQADDPGKGIWIPRDQIKFITVWRERPTGVEHVTEANL